MVAANLKGAARYTRQSGADGLSTNTDLMLWPLFSNRSALAQFYHAIVCVLFVVIELRSPRCEMQRGLFVPVSVLIYQISLKTILISSSVIMDIVLYVKGMICHSLSIE